MNLDNIRDTGVQANFAPEKVTSIRAPDWARPFEARATKAQSHQNGICKVIRRNGGIFAEPTWAKGADLAGSFHGSA
jgi:hypothetical protein